MVALATTIKDISTFIASSVGNHWADFRSPLTEVMANVQYPSTHWLYRVGSWDFSLTVPLGWDEAPPTLPTDPGTSCLAFWIYGFLFTQRESGCVSPWEKHHSLSPDARNLHAFPPGMGVRIHTVSVTKHHRAVFCPVTHSLFTHLPMKAPPGPGSAVTDKSSQFITLGGWEVATT